MLKLFITIALVCQLLLLFACAPVKQTMVLNQPDQVLLGKQLWPDPPDKARYAYLGDITGERNFINSEDTQSKNLNKFISILVGLDFITRDPRVLQRPQNVISHQGRIYVSDVGKQAIFMFDQNLGKFDIWSMAERGEQFYNPIGLAIAGEDELLVADAQLKKIFVLNRHSGEPIRSFGHQLLKRPTGLAYDPITKHIFVSDTQAHNLKIFNIQGELLDVIGKQGIAAGEFNYPTFLFFRDNKLYVSDTMNARVQVLQADGSPIRQIGQRGLYIGNFMRPKGVSADSEGNIYAIESYYDHLLIFNAQGEFLLPIGGAGKSSGKFFLPAGIWLDEKNRLYIADMLNGRIAIFQYLGGL